jgi:serine-type D-Ala-D-Ala carboxypeptidase (penicillin-binding protein 5/6)
VSHPYLQGGRRRRTIRRRARPPRRPGRSGGRGRGRHTGLALGFALIGLIVLGAVLLGFMASRTTGPTRVLVRRQRARAPSTRGLRSQYGTLLAPASEQVNVHLRLPLRSGMLFDVHTGEVLWQRQPTRVLPIASLTKMMTALLVVAHSRPSDSVLITPQAVHFTGSGVGLLPLHKHVPELALLYGLLLPSGNDAAIALAQHVAGTQPAFIAMMNAEARQLGLSCTHYTTESGVIDQGNHSCAADLALLAHLVLEQPLLGRIVGSRSAITPFPIKGGKLYLYNNNPLLVTQYPGTDGVKTGYTQAAGDCLIATARRGRTWLGVVLLHSGNILDQAETMLNAGFAKFGTRGLPAAQG